MRFIYDILYFEDGTSSHVKYWSEKCPDMISEYLKIHLNKWVWVSAKESISGIKKGIGEARARAGKNARIKIVKHKIEPVYTLEIPNNSRGLTQKLLNMLETEEEVKE